MLLILRTYFRLALQHELQYRANFFIQCLTSIMELGAGLASIAIVFSQTTTLAGWSEGELRALLGIFFIVAGVIESWIRPSMQRLMEDVRLGTLDFALTKPADSQVLVSFRQFEIWKAADILMGSAVLIQALRSLHLDFNGSRVATFLLLLTCGVAVVYSFWLMLATSTFWFIKMDNILHIFESVYDAGRWPLTIYPKWLRALLTFVVPVAFAVTLPAEALVGRSDLSMALGAMGLAAAMLLASRWFWRFGVKRYSGASA